MANHFNVLDHGDDSVSLNLDPATVYANAGAYVIGDDDWPGIVAITRVLATFENLSDSNWSTVEVFGGVHNIITAKSASAFTKVLNGADFTVYVPPEQTANWTGAAALNGLWIAPVWDAQADCTVIRSIVADGWAWPTGTAGSHTVNTFIFFQAGYDDASFNGGIQNNAVANLYGMHIPGYTKGLTNNIGLIIGASSTGATRNLSLWSQGDIEVDGLATFDGAVVANGGIQVSTGFVAISALSLVNTSGSQAGGASDIVTIGAYDLSAGNATLAIGTETAVTTTSDFATNRYLNVRINGATYKLMMST